MKRQDQFRLILVFFVYETNTSQFRTDETLVVVVIPDSSRSFKVENFSELRLFKTKPSETIVLRLVGETRRPFRTVF